MRSWVLPINGLVVRDTSPESDGTLRILLEVPNNALGTVEMSGLGSGTITTKSHYRISDVKTAQ
jgi:hypothetical protein